MQTSPGATSKRPGSFLAMIALRAFNGVFGLLTGAVLLTAPDVVVLGGVVLGLSILSLILTVGLWVLQPWARRLTLALIVLTLPMGILGVFRSQGRDPGTYLGIIVDAYTVYLLLQPSIKRLFPPDGQEAGAHLEAEQ